MSKKTKTSNSRRSFLRNSALATAAISLSPIDILTNNLVNGIIEKTIADEKNIDLGKYYVHLALAGGPPRWMFDLPLIPNGLKNSSNQNGDEFGKGPMLVTQMSDYQSLSADYNLFQFMGYYFPHLWSTTVPTSDGGSKPMTELLRHMIMFRGLNLGADGHGMNRVKHVSPTPSGISLNGLAADEVGTPIPSIYMNSSLGYKSRSGVSAANVSSSNPLSTMLSPFKLDSGQSFNNEQIEGFVDRALNLLQRRAAQVDAKNKNMFNDRYSAKRLFKKEFGNLNETFSSLRAKYENLIKRSMSEHNLVGVDMQPLISDGSFKFRVQSNLDNGQIMIQEGVDIRDHIVIDGRTRGMLNAESSQGNTTIGNLASSLALAEFSILNNISNSVTLGSIGHLSNLQLATRDFGLRTGRISNNDAHASGYISTMFYFSKYYKALSACLLEFTDVLKNNTIGNKSYFEKSVIHIGGEFNRIARANGSGADHGWQGSNTSVITGMADRPHIIGNIKKSHGSRGGWGLAGEMNDGRDLIIGNVASSISVLLDKESPTPNDKSYLGLQNGKVQSYEKPKNV